MLEYLGQDVSSKTHQVGDRSELNGQLREVVQILDSGHDSNGHPQQIVVTRRVVDRPSLPALVRWGLRVLAKIGGVSGHDF